MWLRSLYFGLDAVHTAGGVAEGCICYTGDISNPARSSVVRPHSTRLCNSARLLKAMMLSQELMQQHAMTGK